MYKLLKTFFIVVLLSAAAAIGLNFHKGLQTDIYALIGLERGAKLRLIADNLKHNVRVIVAANDFATAKTSAQAIREFAHWPPPPSFADTINFLSTRSSGLLAPSTRTTLQRGEFENVANAALTRLFSFSTPLFPLKNDPMLLADEWAHNLQRISAGEWQLRDGEPIIERNGKTYLLLTGDVDSPEHTLELFAFLNKGINGVQLYCGGAPFHSAFASASSAREINYLSLFSFAIVILLGWLLVRSWRFIPLLIFALLSSFICATAVVFTLFRAPHMLTFVFGTSLIGLGVDYTYHRLSAKSFDELRRPLTIAFVTTTSCFVPLAFSSVGILQQMALFTIAGLTTIFLCVWLFGRNVEINVSPHTVMRKPLPRFVAISILLITAVGIMHVQMGNDPTSFYTPHPVLLQGEKLFLELNNSTNNAFAVTEGATVQEALEKEEQRDIKGLSAIIPSLKCQRENLCLVSNLYAHCGNDYTTKTQIKMPNVTPQFLEPDKITDPLLIRLIKPMLITTADHAYIITPAPQSSNTFVPRIELEKLFSAYAIETYWLSLWSFAALIIILLITFKKQIFRTILPITCAFIATIGTLGWLNETITFFHVLAFFVFAGLGIDYAVFFAHNTSASRTVLYSFLTSFIGLGALSFTSFAVTRGMGMTIALGLAYSYIFAISFQPKPTQSETSTQNWAHLRERGAGRGRLTFMWWLYRLAGKRLVQWLTIPIMLCVYPGAKPARDAIKKFYATLGRKVGHRIIFRQLLNFAWSLTDKLDACTLRKNLPEMSIAQNDDANKFLSLIREGKGMFLISSHLGTIEVLPAIRGITTQSPRVHAFQQMQHNALFTELFVRHLDPKQLTLHPVESIGVETAVEMQEAIAHGDIVLMAGDRLSAATPNAKLHHDFLGRNCVWPKGVFRFAKIMEVPVFCINCIKTGANHYEVRLHFCPPGHDLLNEYVMWLEREVREFPEQWFQFYDFFGTAKIAECGSSPTMGRT